MSSTSENNNDTDTNKQDANNNNKFDQFMTIYAKWQTAATSWIVIYNELVKNASTITEYWLNLFSSPSSRIKEKKDKIKVE